MKKVLNSINKFFNKIFFKIDMSYKNVIIYSICTAIVIAVLNIIPFLKGTSFVMPAETMEIWIVLALVIILNSNSVKDAVIKTFLYFLISQPLIYLIEVPFDENGFKLFSYYGYWFKWTILTIPGSFIAYQVKRNNICSSIILSIACGFLLFYGVNGFITMINNFPYHLLSFIVCSFFGIYFNFLIIKNNKHRIICAILSIFVCIIFIILNRNSSKISMNYIIDEGGNWKIVSSEIESKMIDVDNIDITVNKKGKYKVILENEDTKRKVLIVTYNNDGLIVKEE